MKIKIRFCGKSLLAFLGISIILLILNTGVKGKKATVLTLPIIFNVKKGTKTCKNSKTDHFLREGENSFG